jgi:hypothetical protein
MLRSRAVFAALALGLYTVIGCWVVFQRYGGGAHMGKALAEAMYHLIGVGQENITLNPGISPHVRHIVDWFFGSVDVLTAALIVGVAGAALRPVAHESRHRAEHRRVEDLIRAHGDSSVSRPACRPGLRLLFSPSRAVIALTTSSRTCSRAL